MGWSGTESWTRETGWLPVLVAGGRVIVPSRFAYRFAGHDGDPNSLVRFEIRRQPGEALAQISCVEVKVTPSAGGRPIRPSDFEGFAALGTVGREGCESLALAVDTGPDPVSGEVSAVPLSSPKMKAVREELRRELRDGIASSRRNRKRPTPREELERVAAIYQTADRAPITAVMTAQSYTRRTAARRIAEARSAGLLPSGQRQEGEAPPAGLLPSGQPGDHGATPAGTARREADQRQAKHEALAARVLPPTKRKA